MGSRSRSDSMQGSQGGGGGGARGGPSPQSLGRGHRTVSHGETTGRGSSKSGGGGGGSTGGTGTGGTTAGNRHLSRQLHVPDSIDALDSTLDVIYGPTTAGSSSSSSAQNTRAMLAMHSGPYDAASAHRNRNPASKHAPVGAFSSGLGVVDPVTGTVISGFGRDDGPYGAVARSPPPAAGAGSGGRAPLSNQDSAYPGLRSPTREVQGPTGEAFASPAKGPVFGPASSTSNEMKARHHEVMFGVQEGEAYEDFAVGGKVSMEHDRRTSLADAASRSTSTTRMTDMAGPGKNSTYGQGPLRMVDPKDGREDLVNGMNGLGLYGGNQSPGHRSGPAGGLGSSTFLEGSQASQARGGSPRSPALSSPRQDRPNQDYFESDPSSRPSEASAKSGVRRNKSLVKRLKNMRENPNMPYQASDSEPEDRGLRPSPMPNTSSTSTSKRPGVGSRSISTGSSAGPNPPPPQFLGPSPHRARSKSSASPSFQPLGKTKSRTMGSEEGNEVGGGGGEDRAIGRDQNGGKSPKSGSSFLQRVTSGRWRKKE